MKTDISGWWFLEIDEGNKIIAHGQILDVVGEGFFLCRFSAPWEHRRIVSSEWMLRWVLFTNVDDFEHYLKTDSGNRDTDELRRRALEAVSEGPKDDPDEEDPLQLPDAESESEDDEEATEFGFMCIECEVPFERMITLLPDEKFVRANCPECGKLITNSVEVS